MKTNKLRTRLAFQKLAKLPVGDISMTVPIRLVFIKGELSVICPVNKLNNLPKGLPFRVQGDWAMDDNFENASGCVTKEGKLFVWADEIR